MLKKIALVCAITLSMSSCVHNLGQFTTASSMNVRNLEYSPTNSASVRGKSCLYFFVGQHSGRLQAAMDDAIRNGRAKGLDGDILMDVRMNITVYPFVNCVSVTGTLVQLKKIMPS